MLGDQAAPSPDTPSASEVVAGRYRIERELGHGGMGVVFAATHVLTGRRVALKWMRAEKAKDSETAAERFVREARAAGRIEHPNVVQVLDVGEDKRGPFIVMELLNGEPLAALLARMRLRPAEAIDLLMPAMRGVHAAHLEGVVHRDLKPDNIFLCRDKDGALREAKVLDFGISKLTWDEEPVTTITRPGVMVGTPHYMAPERVRGHLDGDPRTDVYSFGVMLYEVLTGKLPFESPHIGDLIAQITTGTPRKLREIDPTIPLALENVVLKAMARRIEDRHESIEQLALELEPFAAEQRFRVQRRDPTGHQPIALHKSDAPTLLHESPAAGIRAADANVIARRRSSARIAIAAAALLALVLGIGYAALAPAHAESELASAAPRPAAARGSGAATRAAAAETAPKMRSETSVPNARFADEAAAAATASGANPEGDKRATKARAASARRAPAVKSTSPKRPRIARGVRTRGMSEQDF